NQMYLRSRSVKTDAVLDDGGPAEVGVERRARPVLRSGSATEDGRARPTSSGVVAAGGTSVLRGAATEDRPAPLLLLRRRDWESPQSATTMTNTPAYSPAPEERRNASGMEGNSPTRPQY